MEALGKIVLLSFVLTVIVYAVNANTLRDPYICGQPKCNTIDKLKYSKYVSYNYKYGVLINTMFEGSSENKSSLSIDAEVTLEFITECEGLLKIHSISMNDQDENYLQEREQSFAEKLSAHNLRFALHNGIITEICPQEEEEEWTLNFKRGILSLFQNSMSRFDIDFDGLEKDIHGVCNTKYNMQGQQNTSLIVSKTKDLTQCMDRYKYLSILQTVRYNFQSKFQTWPVIKSESRCRIIIDHSIYTKINCRERHLFEPFSGKQSGAMTTVFQNLELLNETHKSNDDIMEEKNEELEVLKLRYDLLHHHIPTARSSIGLLQSARDILKQLCKIEETRIVSATTSENDKESQKMENSAMVGIWGEFVRACRGLPYASLSQLYSRAHTICPEGKKHIIDALPYIASVGSVELIKDMILKNTVNEETNREWLMSIAMIPRPHEHMIVSMGELLKVHPTDKFISLAVSSMVHSYCKNGEKTLTECCEEVQNAKIINIFESNVKMFFSNINNNFTRYDVEKIVISIKALGNIGGFSNHFRDLLMKVIDDPSQNLLIRISAVDAFRRTPCAEMRNYFLQIFQEKYINVEIRLAAYLQVMRCPRYVIIRKILEILKNEEINQVSSFVWSHLENLGKSPLPSKVEKQGFLSGNTIPKPKQNADFRKFSRNFEHGFFFDEFNAGGNCEANVIISPDSYIPRSLSLNLTLDMFGESINIIEVKTRGEGFEQSIEKIFSNDGILSRSKIDEKLSSLRFLRSAENEVNPLKAKVSNINFKNEALNHRLPKLDFAVKVFGNEISYWNAEGDEEILDAIKELNPLYHIDKILSGKEIDYRKASLFLDTTFSIPTGCGLPMTMNLLGTNIINLKMSGSISNIKNFHETMNLDFEGKINPSMALNIAATMGVNGGGLAGTAIKINFRLHTTTDLSVNLELRSSELASLKISLPHSKQEIFEAKSELIVLHGNKEFKQIGFNKNKVEESTCSWSFIDKAIGIKLCASYQFPNVTNVNNAPYFIMAGPAHYLLSLEKSDPTATVYSFNYSWKSNLTTNVINFLFDTPGSKAKRSFDSTVIYSKQFGSATMTFQSAESYLKAHATYKNFANLKLLECALDIDGKKHFDAVMSVHKQDQKNGFVYIPKVYIAVNNEKITELAGTLKLAQKKGVSQCDVSLEFQTKKLASRLIGYITWNGPSKGTKLRLDYQFLGEQRETIRIETLLSNREIGLRSDLYGELGLEFSSYPHLNFFTDVKYMGTPNHVDLTFNVSSSRQLKGENATLLYSYSKHRTYEGFKLQNHLQIMKPYLDLIFQYEENGALTLLSAVADYDKLENPDSVIGLWGKLYIPPGTRLYLEAGLNITLPRFVPFTLNVNILEKKPQETDISAKCVWFTGTDASLIANYKDLSTSHSVSHKIKAVLTSTKFTQILTELKFSQDNKQLNIDVKADQGEDQYGIMGRYIVYSEKNFSCYAQLEFKSKKYSFNVLANLKNNTNILAEIHLDNLRDIRIIYSKLNSLRIKKLNADINWDANRNPDQKLSLELELLNTGSLNYGGSFRLFYPDRLISGDFEFLAKDWLCMWHIKLGWSPDDNIMWKVKMYSEIEQQTMYALLSEMDTPFHGWRDTSLNLVWRFVDNLQEFNANMTWEKERVLINLLSDYFLKTNEVYGELRGLINSTLSNLPNAAAIAKHKHYWRKSADTLLSFEFNDDGMLMINSSWKIDRNSKNNNITGRVGLKSPFPGYKSGLFKTNFFFNHRRDIQGETYINLEEDTFKIVVEGHTRRFTNNILNINVTSSSSANSQLMVARFGIIDKDRHVVALVETPNITIGLEIIFKLQSTQDFHVYGFLAIPVDFLQNVKILAKRNTNEIDFKLGFENMVLGFTGIWQYNSNLNFKYIYKLYTPLKGFEENGLVLKNIYDNGLDSEISIKLSKHKLGITVLIKDHDKGLLKIIEEKYRGIQSTNLNSLIEDFSTDISITLDPLFYDTIKFNANLKKIEGENEEEILTVNAILLLPNSTKFVLVNQLIIEDLTTMRNNFNLLTPYAKFSEINFIQTIEITLNEKYNITGLLSVNQFGKTLENSVKILYDYDTGENEDYTNHIAMIQMSTQLESLKSVDAKIDIFIDDSTSKLNANIDLPSCHLTTNGQVEVDESFVNVIGALNLSSPYFHGYKIHVNFKKDFTETENLLIGGIQVQQGNHNNYLALELAWHANNTDHLKMKTRCSLIPVIPPSDIYIEFGKSEKSRVLRMEAHIGSKDMLYSLNAEQHSKFTTVALISPHRGFRNVNFTGEIHNNKIIKGVFHGDTITYNIEGKIISENPFKMVVKLQPIGDGESFTIHLQTSGNSENYNLTASVISKIQFVLHVNLQNGKNYREIFAKLDSSHQSVEEIYLRSRLNLHSDGKISLNAQAVTPLQRLKTLDIDTQITLTGKTGSFLCAYNITNLQGSGDIKWSWLVNNIYLKALNRHSANGDLSSLDLDSYFCNICKNSSSDIGFFIDIDNSWKIGANTTLLMEQKKYATVTINVLLPKPNIDIHTFKANVHFDSKNIDKSMYVKYVTDVSQHILMASGKMKILPNNVFVNVTTVDGIRSNERIIENLINMEKSNNYSYELNYAITTPLFINEETLKLQGSYEGDNKDFTILKGKINYPASNELSNLDISYNGMKHTFGSFNSTTPFEHLRWLSTDIKVFNGEILSENIIKVSWPNNSALLNAVQKLQQKNEMSFQNGNIQIELPLNTKHILSGDYEFRSAVSHSEGNVKLFHNAKQFVEGIFKKVTDQTESNLLRDTIDMHINNSYTPVGIHYIHQYDNRDTIDIKQASVYELNDLPSFNITGRIDIESWKAGKEVRLMAIHGDHTVKFQNNYESKEKELYQRSKIEWSPSVWFEYDIYIQNKTKEIDESQELNMNIRYPERELGLVAFYHLQETLLQGTAVLNWSISNDNKTVKIYGKWDSPEAVDVNQHNIEIILAHPSFNKDVTLTGNYITDISTTSNLSASLEYSDFENEKLSFNSMIQDNSNGPIRDYRLELNCKHPATNLELEVKSDLYVKHKLYYYNHFYKYKKSLFNEVIRQSKIYLDVKAQYIQYEQTRDEDWYNLNATWNGAYPEYSLNFNVNRTKGNDTGICLISGKNKNLIAHFNKTFDISYHLIGQINDPRSADLIAWRDFEDVKTIDISSYIQLNHSRLLTSKIKWRPEMYQQIKGSLIQSLRTFYSETNEVFIIIKSIPMEIHDAMKNVWSDARSRVKDLLNDLNDLHIIKSDIDEFQSFINESYDANAFYLKDIIEFTLHVLDQLALKNQIESLPDIINEMWQLMGETGSSLRKSILWIIDTLKTSYAQLVEKINKFLEADLMDTVSELLEKGISQYDTFVKNLHLSFTQYCETAWATTIMKMRVFWTNTLKAVEPTYLQIAHYVESFVYKFGTEVLDFFYARTNELTEAPFFSMLSEFSHDIDKFTKDIQNNDAITNIRKYTDIFVKFVKEKVLIHIPFQKELKDIGKEIWDELNKLEELSLVKIVKLKFWEAKSRLQWWYDYFKIGEALKNVATVIYQKMTEIPRTAIQNEEKHRIAKTNFIFNPQEGIILLEQKLPMPWHAFNRTPDFSEIAEYKMVRDVVDTWVFSNTSFMSYYYIYKQYTNIYNLIPPFTGQAIMTGYGTVITFDKRVFTVNEPGTFLLLSDFLSHNITLLIKSMPQQKYNIILITKKNLVEVDLFQETIKIGHQKLSILPIQIDNWVIHRNEEYITIHSIDGITIKCDCHYKTCVINVEGWYFSRLGGLLGTMNNEPFDDMMTPDRQITTFKTFLESWKIDNMHSKIFLNENFIKNSTECEIYFKTKASSLKACFSVVDPDPYYNECIDGQNPCVLANIYLEACLFNYIPLRLPNKCMECKAPSGKILEEGTFNDISMIPNATDVVFLVEAHECNKNLRKEKNIDMIINTLELKLVEKGYVENRYAIVGFGGEGIYRTAHSLYVNGKSFANSREVVNYFDYIQIESLKINNSYNADTFDAFNVASNLNFRPGVSKTFILFPCTRCDVTFMKLDYSVMHQVLMDSSITLHIIMDDEFKLNKKRIAKNLYGIDSTYAYTSKDLKGLVGDSKLRQQIKLPKTKLGFCSSLAIETNGTIFSGIKFKSTESGGGRKAAIVLGTRITQSSRPCAKARCECDRARLKCSGCPRHLSRNPIDDFTSTWDSSELDDFIDNFLDMPTDII